VIEERQRVRSSACGAPASAVRLQQRWRLAWDKIRAFATRTRRVIAVDTNVLVYAHREDSPWHEVACARLAELAEGAPPGRSLALHVRVPRHRHPPRIFARHAVAAGA